MPLPGDFQFQLVTFMLELCGLTLALVEVRMPLLGARIARFLGELAAPIEDLRRERQAIGSDDGVLGKRLERVLTRVVTLGSVTVFGIFFLEVLTRIVNEGFAAAWFVPLMVNYLILMIIAMIMFTLIGVALFFTVAAGSDFATRFVEGRAVGTLGIILASLGLALEFFQLLDAFAI